MYLIVTHSAAEVLVPALILVDLGLKIFKMLFVIFYGQWCYLL